MEYAEVLERLTGHLARFAGPGADIREDDDIVTRLGLDSVKVLDVVLEVEEEFDISIPMNALADVRTVRDLAGAIHQLTAAK